MNGYPQFPAFASILWGWKVPDENRLVTREQALETLLKDLDAAVFSQANAATWPGIWEAARKVAPGCRVYAHVNGMSVWSRPSVYWPMQDRILTWANDYDAWLYRADGQRAIGYQFGQSMTWLVDITHPAFRVRWREEMHLYADETGGCPIFIDEAHSTLGFCRRAGDNRSDGRAWPTDEEWSGAMQIVARLALSAAGSPPMFNGTMPTTGAGPRRYIQGAAFTNPAILAEQMLAAHESQPPHNRQTVIQWRPGNNDTFGLHLASICGASIEFNEAPWALRPFSVNACGIKPGAWGKGEEDALGNPAVKRDGSKLWRQFDHALLGVDLATRQPLNIP